MWRATEPRIIRTVLLVVLAASPLAAQLNFSEAQKLYEEALGAVQRQSAIPSEREKVAPLVGRLRSARGWNNTADVYELLQIVRAHQAVADFLPSSKERDELHTLMVRLDAHFRGLLTALERRTRNPDRDNLARYAEANRELGLPTPGERRVVFLGDSITDVWKLTEYFSGKPYVNRGIGGQTTGEILGRMKADVLDLKPAAVLVLAGINDLVRQIEVGVTKNNLAMIGDLARANNIRPIFASVLPVRPQDLPPQTPQLLPGKILEINDWLRQHCREQGFTYLDYFSAMVDGEGLLKAELGSDGVHPNAAGHKIMASLAQAAIEKALLAAGTSRRRK